MARHRRHLRGLVRFPGLGALSMPSSVKPMDVLLGLGLGLAGSAGLKMGADKLAAGGTSLPAFLTSGSPLVGGAATGAILYVAQKKKNPGRAAGHALGAVLGGIAIWASGMLQNVMAGAPVLASTAGWGFRPTTLPAGMAGMGAPLFNNPRLQGYAGPIFNNPNVNLGRLAQMQGVGDENEDGMFPAP